MVVLINFDKVFFDIVAFHGSRFETAILDQLAYRSVPYYGVEFMAAWCGTLPASPSPKAHALITKLYPFLD